MKEIAKGTLITIDAQDFIPPYVKNRSYVLHFNDSKKRLLLIPNDVWKIWQENK